VSGWIARRCYVAGRVQGVFFRASTRERAHELGVTGYARNLPDGRVEVLACGTAPAVQQLCDWLWKGPPASRVDDVRIEELRAEDLPQKPERFGTR
jgi:acylphosphatase